MADIRVYDDDGRYRGFVRRRGAPRRGKYGGAINVRYETYDADGRYMGRATAHERDAVDFVRAGKPSRGRRRRSIKLSGGDDGASPERKPRRAYTVSDQRALRRIEPKIEDDEDRAAVHRVLDRIAADLAR